MRIRPVFSSALMFFVASWPAFPSCPTRVVLKGATSIPSSIPLAIGVYVPGRPPIEAPVTESHFAEFSDLPCGAVARVVVQVRVGTPDLSQVGALAIREVVIAEGEDLEVDISSVSLLDLSVSAAGGTPVGGASISLIPLSGASASTSLAAMMRTDAEGRLVLPLMASDYTVMLGLHAIDRLELDGITLTSARIRLQAQQLHRLHIVLDLPSVVRVAATFEDGSPASGVSISIENQAGGTPCVACAATGASGAAEIPVTGFPAVLSFFDPSGRWEIEPRRIEIGSAPEGESKVKVVPAAGTPLVVDVHDESHHAIDGASVVARFSVANARGESSGGVRMGRTDSKGRATLVLPPECALQMEVSPPSGSQWIARSIETNRDGDLDQLSVELQSSIGAALVVRYPNGDPAAGVVLTARGTSGSAERSVSDQDGRATVYVTAPGRYLFELVSPVSWKGKLLRVVAKQSGSGAEAPSFEVATNTPEGAKPHALELGSGAEVCSSIELPDGTPESVVTVRVVPEGTDNSIALRSATVAAPMTTVCSPLVPDGTYRVGLSTSVRDGGLAPLWWPNGVTRAEGVPVTVRRGRAPVLTLRMRPSGSVLLSMPEQSLSGDASFEVRLCRQPPRDGSAETEATCTTWPEENMTPSRPTDKTAAGWLVFGIEPGRWRIQVCRAERCGPESDLFVIEQGGLATIPIDWPAAE